MKKLLFLSILISTFYVSTFADIRLPDDIKPSPETKSNKKEKRMSLSISVNPNYKEPVLRIPRGAVKNLRAQLDDIEETNSNYAGGMSISRTQTLMSGLFFSLALVFGGVWVLRGKSFGKNQKIVSGLLIFGLLGASVYTVFANAAPPPLQGIDDSLFSDKMKSRWRGARGTVKIEISENEDSGSPIQLIVPSSRNSVNGEE